VLLEKLIFQLRYLFMDDPIAYDDNGKESQEFCQMFDLSVDWMTLNQIANGKVERTTPNSQEHDIIEEDETIDSGAEDKQQKPMTLSRLSTIEKDLLVADISRVIRKQPICSSVKKKGIRRVYDELYIHISHLRDLMMGDVNFTSNLWLFKYLTQIMDEKVLTLLARNPDRYFDVPVSINLNVATVLSNIFSDFEQAIKDSIKVSVVIEIQATDVFADPNAFIAARELLQKKGYRVCLDGLTSLSFSQLDREKLGFDLAKLQWDGSTVDDLKTKQNQSVIAAVERYGKGRVILCRCDSKDAVAYGNAIGISLFQGRFLDKRINPQAKVEN